MKLILTNRAKIDLDNIEQYLLEKWGWEVYESFLDRLEECIEEIKDGIIIHQYYKNTKYKKVLITKHNTLIYNIQNNTLYLMTILNNYKDPNTNYNIVETL